MHFKTFSISAAICLATMAVSAQATVLLQENFSGGTPAANSSLAGTQFKVTSGSVDLLGVLNGSVFNCVDNPSGNCIDMVGSPGAGAISSIPTFNLVAGDTYTITFGYILQGFDSTSTATSEFTVGLGSFSDLLTAIPSVQDASISFTATTSQTGAALSFTTDTAPDAVHGAVLDNIALTQTGGAVTAAPESSSVGLLTLGCSVLCLARRWKPSLRALGF